MLLLLIILFLVFGGGGGYYWGSRSNGVYGPHFGLGAFLLVLFVIWLLGGFSSFHGMRW
jgi:hypothetical protein